MRKETNSHLITLKKDRKANKPVQSKFVFNKRNLYYILDLGLGISFILIFVTGILKLLDLYGYVFYPMGYLVNTTIVHDWSSLIFGIIASLHAVLHLKWFGQKIKQIFKPSLI